VDVNNDEQPSAPTRARSYPEHEDHPRPPRAALEAPRSRPGALHRGMAARTMPSARERARAAREARRSHSESPYPGASTMLTTRARARAAREATPYPAAPTEPLAETPLPPHLVAFEAGLPNIGEETRQRLHRTLVRIVETDIAREVLATFRFTLYAHVQQLRTSAQNAHLRRLNRPWQGPQDDSEVIDVDAIDNETADGA
jgi:hypothetical protein